VQASVVRRKRLAVLTRPKSAAATEEALGSAPTTVPEPQDQPVPWGWQSTGSDLRPVRPNFEAVTVPPQEPPVQPQPVLSAGGPLGAAPLGATALGGAGSFGAEATAHSQPPARPQPVVLAALSRIETDYANLLLLARSLEKLARDEIERLSGVRPNDPRAIQENQRQRDLLSILAD
jgi:hypothetical protein